MPDLYQIVCLGMMFGAALAMSIAAFVVALRHH